MSIPGIELLVISPYLNQPQTKQEQNINIKPKTWNSNSNSSAFHSINDSEHNFIGTIVDLNVTLIYSNFLVLLMSPFSKGIITENTIIIQSNQDQQVSLDASDFDYTTTKTQRELDLSHLDHEIFGITELIQSKSFSSYHSELSRLGLFHNAEYIINNSRVLITPPLFRHLLSMPKNSPLELMKSDHQGSSDSSPTIAKSVKILYRPFPNSSLYLPHAIHMLRKNNLVSFNAGSVLLVSVSDYCVWLDESISGNRESYLELIHNVEWNINCPKTEILLKIENVDIAQDGKTSGFNITLETEVVVEPMDEHEIEFKSQIPLMIPSPNRKSCPLNLLSNTRPIWDMETFVHILSFPSPPLYMSIPWAQYHYTLKAIYELCKLKNILVIHCSLWVIDGISLGHSLDKSTIRVEEHIRNIIKTAEKLPKAIVLIEGIECVKSTEMWKSVKKGIADSLVNIVGVERERVDEKEKVKQGGHVFTLKQLVQKWNYEQRLQVWAWGIQNSRVFNFIRIDAERRIAAATESDVLQNIRKVAQKGAERALKFLELEHREEGGSDTKRLKAFLADSFDQLQVIVADGDLPVVEKTSAIQRVQWDDIGGLENVKKELHDLLEGPRGGVLLYGPPGTGKTLVAKALATEMKVSFISVKGPELLDAYIGESEANIRRVFERARRERPCVLFFDEMESLVPKRGMDGSGGGGVMDRVVASMVGEIDKGDQGLFLVGATNRPDLLDSSLLRPGRFDKMLYLGPARNIVTKTKLLAALTRKVKLSPTVVLSQVAELCPPHLTGADFYALVTDAVYKATKRTIDQAEESLETWNSSGPHFEDDQRSKTFPHPTSMAYYLEHILSPDDYSVEISMTDLTEAIDGLRPSIGEQEMQRYEALRLKYEGQKKDKGKGNS